MIPSSPADALPPAEVRPMQAGDVAAVGDVSAAAFDVDISSGPFRVAWEGRVAFSLQTDPGGAFVASVDGHVVGAAQAIVREGLWCLSLLAVRPGGQSAGAGGRLLRATLGYGNGWDRGLIISSNDPRALRLYHGAGFRLLPTFEAVGEVDRTASIDAGVTVAGAGELESLAPISRLLRGAAHTRELQFALTRGATLLRLGDRGFAVVMPEGRVWMVAARDEEAARRLLWSAVAIAGEEHAPVTVRWITGEQPWALDVVLAAGLKLTAYGAIALRGPVGPLAPYIPSPPFG